MGTDAEMGGHTFTHTLISVPAPAHTCPLPTQHPHAPCRPTAPIPPSPHPPHLPPPPSHHLLTTFPPPAVHIPPTVSPSHVATVASCVKILESYLDFSSSASSAFRDAGGLGALVARLAHEVCVCGVGG